MSHDAQYLSNLEAYHNQLIGTQPYSNTPTSEWHDSHQLQATDQSTDQYSGYNPPSERYRSPLTFAD
jgi:hypothetical protein